MTRASCYSTPDEGFEFRKWVSGPDKTLLRLRSFNPKNLNSLPCTIHKSLTLNTAPAAIKFLNWYSSVATDSGIRGCHRWPLPASGMSCRRSCRSMNQRRSVW